MLRPIILALALPALVVAGAAAQQAAVTALSEAAAATAAAQAPYAFDFELQTSDRLWRARFDPDAQPKLQLLQPRREELSNDERTAFDRMAQNMEGVSWCASDNLARVEDVRLLREDETSATYSFQPTPESIRGEQARRFAHRLRGELTITKSNPDVIRVRMFTPRAFNPMPLVEVQHFNVLIQCVTAPNGRRYAGETVTDIRASAFGRDINERSVQRIRNLSAP
ncbi:MAG: hypothetical protein K2P58_04290 [Hyphomonadaceae bacterium]|nr:hypothetical protein [Hyphomonadaceae bacterium]